MGLLDEKAAVVTGGAQGIGLAIAQRLAAEGAAVVVADVDEARSGEAAQTIVAAGGKAIGVACDVTSPAAVEALVGRCREQLGALDVMVNNAGITRDATMRKMSVEDFDAVIAVHLKGTWLGTKAASLAMREQGDGGSIVNISSISGKVGNIGQTNYSAAKAGIVGLTKAAAKEVAHAGVRVNAIQPGLIRTAMTEAMPAEIFAQREEEVPLGRAGEPDEIAKTVLFLASDLSSYITGIVIEVAGGRHI
ncbi:MAG: 3-oxoacyl-ACP reductase FabG [Actinobacteria bacterium]|nr:3-oxoacyl-ACP reductase FabG [Actinomycetota bacterium]